MEKFILFIRYKSCDDNSRKEYSCICFSMYEVISKISRFSTCEILSIKVYKRNVKPLDYPF